MSTSPLGDILFAFLSILLEGAPYILLGTLISGFIDAYLPAGVMEKLLPKRVLPAILVSGLLGAVFPVCECAIVPVIRRLVQKGLPVGCAITYMLAAPIINPIVVFSTASAFSGQDPVFMTSSRLIMAYIVAVVAGIVVSRLPIAAVLRGRVVRDLQAAGHSGVMAAGNLRETEERERVSVGSRIRSLWHRLGEGMRSLSGSGDQRLIQAVRTAQRDFCDTGMFFVIGVAITSVFNTQFDQALLDPIAGNDAFAVPAMMVLAFVLSLCSTSDAFIAAAMDTFSQVAKLAFLVFGPMMDIKLVFMYLAVFNRRFVIGTVFGLFVLIIVLCLGWSVANPAALMSR